MPLFRATYRSIEGESDGRSPLVPGALILLLAAWIGWFSFAKVTVHEASENARIEVLHARFDVDSPVAGRVVALPNMALGAEIHEGDPLLEIDSERLRLELVDVSAQEDALAHRIDSKRDEVEAEKRAIRHERQQRVSEADVARSLLEGGKIDSHLAEEEHRRATRLLESGSIGEAEASRLRAELGRRRSAESALEAGVRKITSEASVNEDDRQSHVAELGSDLAELAGSLESARARAALLRHDIERCQIRAPASGTVGAISELRPGSMLKEGDRIATIVAPGRLRIIGNFAPAGVFGRVHVGQPAKVQLDGFPWTEYGTLSASVSSVASEVRDDHARVELVIERVPDSGIPVQHGLPGRVTIEIERTTPATLVLRAIGRALSSSTPAPAGQEGEP